MSFCNNSHDQTLELGNSASSDRITPLLPRNARTHSEKQINQIAAAIKEFGFTNPVLIDEENVVLADHGRLAAAKLLEIEIIPAIRLDHLNDAQKRAYFLTDNRLGFRRSVT